MARNALGCRGTRLVVVVVVVGREMGSGGGGEVALVQGGGAVAKVGAERGAEKGDRC